MSAFTTDSGTAYLDEMYEKSWIALAGAVQDVRWNQFEVSRLIGEVLAAHDSQDSIVWRMTVRKLGVDTRALDTMLSPAIDRLREIRTHILALGISDEIQGVIEFALWEVHSGADMQKKNLNLEEVE